jgi:protein-disulfide isomerase
MVALGAMEGNPKSAVRVIIYEDLQCPDCADFRRMMDEQVLAAVAARFFEEITPELGLEFRRHVLANIRNTGKENFNDRLSAFAVKHDVAPGKALAALDDQRLAALVEKDFQEGVARGVSKTPTVLVNGQPFVETFTLADFAKAMDANL